MWQARPGRQQSEFFCTRVVFCGAACSTVGRNHQCPGAPDPVVDLQQRLRDTRASGDSPIFSSPNETRKFQEERERDIAGPLRQTVLQQAIRDGGIDNVSVEYFRKLADQSRQCGLCLPGRCALQEPISGPHQPPIAHGVRRPHDERSTARCLGYGRAGLSVFGTGRQSGHSFGHAVTRGFVRRRSGLS